MNKKTLLKLFLINISPLFSSNLKENINDILIEDIYILSKFFDIFPVSIGGSIDFQEINKNQLIGNAFGKISVISYHFKYLNFSFEIFGKFDLVQMIKEQKFYKKYGFIWNFDRVFFKFINLFLIYDFENLTLSGYFKLNYTFKKYGSIGINVLLKNFKNSSKPKNNNLTNIQKENKDEIKNSCIHTTTNNI